MKYVWLDAEHTTIRVTTDEGEELFVPTDPGNRHYAAMLAEEIEPEAYTPPAEPRDV